MSDLRQELYLIADEMRGMATLGKHFANNIYEVERAHRIVELAAKVAALADEGTLADVRAVFDAEPWHRASPAIGVEAAVFDPQGASCSSSARTMHAGRHRAASRRSGRPRRKRRCANSGKRPGCAARSGGSSASSMGDSGDRAQKSTSSISSFSSNAQNSRPPPAWRCWMPASSRPMRCRRQCIRATICASRSAAH